MKYEVYYIHKVKLDKVIFSVEVHDCIIDKKEYKEWKNNLFQALRPVMTDYLTSLLLKLVLDITTWMFQNGVKRKTNCSRQWEAGVHCSDMFFGYNSKSGNRWHTAGLDSQSQLNVYTNEVS